MSIDVQNFFKFINGSTHAAVTGFVIEDVYPLLFFSLILRKQWGAEAIHIDLNEQEEQTIKAQLETSFLGMMRIYRLSGMHALPKPVIQRWLQYFSMYQGPNRLLFTVSKDAAEPYKKEKKNNILFVEIPAHIQKPFFTDLFTQLMHQPTIIEKRYIDQLYLKTEKIPLDTACILIQYLRVLGSTAQDFFAHWVYKLVIPDKSLFVLSQYFFAKQPKQFLAMWATVKDQYPEQFWISFWSEQIWRALFYCQSMQQRDIAEAKKIGFRLPFSFLQKDYRGCDIKQLQEAHERLCELDHNLKNGAGMMGLDLFFLCFFAN